MKFIANRIVDELGRVVLPTEVRNNLNVQGGDTVDIYINDDTVVVKKNESVPRCVICGMPDNLTELSHTVKKSYICEKCKTAIQKVK